MVERHFVVSKGFLWEKKDHKKKYFAKEKRQKKRVRFFAGAGEKKNSLCVYRLYRSAYLFCGFLRSDGTLRLRPSE